MLRDLYPRKSRHRWNKLSGDTLALAITRKICVKRSTLARFYKLAPKFFDIPALSPARIQIATRVPHARWHIAVEREREKEEEENSSCTVLVSLSRAFFPSRQSHENSRTGGNYPLRPGLMRARQICPRRRSFVVADASRIAGAIGKKEKAAFV